jgi:hypothetical protein
MDYVAGWSDGDAGRMERALHPELVKPCRGIEDGAPDALETLPAGEMIDATAAGRGAARMRPAGGSRSGSTTRAGGGR